MTIYLVILWLATANATGLMLPTRGPVLRTPWENPLKFIDLYGGEVWPCGGSSSRAPTPFTVLRGIGEEMGARQAIFADSLPLPDSSTPELSLQRILPATRSDTFGTASFKWVRQSRYAKG